MEKNEKKSIIKIFFIFLFVLIIVASIVLNCYFYITYIKKSDNSSNNNSITNSSEHISFNNTLQNNSYLNTSNLNTTSDFSSNTSIDINNTTKPLNQISNSTIIDLTTPDEKTPVQINTYDLNELKTLIEQYSVGIQRIDYQYENLESNTILLFIAKRFFDTNSSKSSLKVDTKYASTAENFHKYLTELTGKKYNNIEYISSYTNYIGYSKTNKAYVLGKDSSVITNEDYACTAIDVIDNQNDLYTAKAIVRRTANDVKTVYQITFDFKINSDYEYQKYQIVSLTAVNSSFYPDNTVHLIEN